MSGTVGRIRWASSCLIVALVATSCAGAATTPEARAVSLETTACGNASRTTGAGVIVEDGWILASAHVVIGAGSVEVTGPDGREFADVIVLDVEGDLALLSVPSAQASPIELAKAATGDVIDFAGGGPSDAFTASVLRPLEVRIEAVRSQERISRFGYEVDVRVELGDSGGGGFDDEGRLVGIIFGRTDQDEERSFIVGDRQISAVLASDRSGLWSCDPTQNRVTSDVP